MTTDTELIPTTPAPITPTTQRRRYTEAEKASALVQLAACRYNYERAAQQTSIPWTTLRSWHRGTGVNADVSFMQRKIAAERADLCEQKIDLLTDAITPERIAGAPLTQIAVTIGILIDKAQLLRSITAVSPEEMERRQQAVTEIILRHVPDHATRAAIANDLRQLRPQE